VAIVDDDAKLVGTLSASDIRGIKLDDLNSVPKLQLHHNWVLKT